MNFINSELSNLYDFWTKNHSKFFDQCDIFDKEITDKFSSLLEKNIEFDVRYGNELFVAYIILYDQIPRHIYRRDTSYKIDQYLQYICPIVLDNYQKYTGFTALEFSFVLLPLRHSNKFRLINKSIEIIWNELKITTRTDYIQQYKKFLHASYIRYSTKNTDIDNLELISHTDENTDNTYNELFNKFYLDSLCWRNKNIIYKSTDHIVYKKVKDYVKTNNITYGIISLSGGVDSMVLSLVLKNLNIDLIAVHINYSNRKECVEEEKIVKNWCKYVLKIPLYIRTLNEINRKDCMKYEMRELYETYTKNIRFNSYKNAQKYFNMPICNVFT